MPIQWYVLGREKGQHMLLRTVRGWANVMEPTVRATLCAHKWVHLPMLCAGQGLGPATWEWVAVLLATAVRDVIIDICVGRQQ